MKSLTIGMIGAGQVAKSHVLGFSSLPVLYGTHLPKIEFSTIAEMNEELAKDAARRFGFRNWTVDWRKVTRSKEVELVDIVTPTHLHVEPAIDAAQHHKHIICEKPLATNSEQARQMYEAAQRAGIVHIVGFNYRKLAAVAFAKALIDEGKLGKIYHFRGSFMEDWGADPNFNFTWRFQSAKAAAGALADLGSHVIDLARHLLGEIRSVCAVRRTFVHERPLPGANSKRGKVDADDTFMCLLEFENDVIGRIEASWLAHGRKVHLEFELNGSDGSLYFNLERPNELQIYSSEDPKDRQGYRTILMGPVHPFGNGIVFPAPGTGMGFQESLTNEVYDLVKGIQEKQKVSPSFYDGWKVNQVIDAIIESAEKRRWQAIG